MTTTHTHHTTPAGHPFRIEHDGDFHEVQTPGAATGTVTDDGWACWPHMEVSATPTVDDLLMIGEQLDDDLSEE